MSATSEDAAGSPVVVSVCVSCRAAAGTEDLRPGADLLARLREAALDPAVEVRPVQCMSVCKRPCTVALSSPGRYTYVFGDLDPNRGVADLVACIDTYRANEHGYMLWRERPESLRGGILARLPPIGWSPPDGSHPR